MRQLVFVHGRAQESKDAAALKGEWIEAFRAGLAKSGLDLPIPERDIRFPYYGQTLFDLTAGTPLDRAAPVVVRGHGTDRRERVFTEAVLREIGVATGLSDEIAGDEEGRRIVTRGALNMEWLQRALMVIDRRFPFASDGSIKLFTQDVYRYLYNIGIRDQIDMGVRQALTPGIPAVVVSHSLGTVVSYSLLRRDGAANGWVVPLYVTLGSPLAVTAIRESLAPHAHPACVGEWFNAMDERDVVALYPLTAPHFPMTPPVENKTGVQNHTPNRHGITGYLDDADVARRIYQALVA